MMNIQTHRWEPKLLEHCGGHDLYQKLGLEPVEGGVELGKINAFYVKRYGFHPGNAYGRGERLNSRKWG